MRHYDKSCLMPLKNNLICCFGRHKLSLDDDGKSDYGELSCKITGTFIGESFYFISKMQQPEILA